MLKGHFLQWQWRSVMTQPLCQMSQRFSQITVLASFHWLLIWVRIDFKILLIMFFKLIWFFPRDSRNADPVWACWQLQILQARPFWSFQNQPFCHQDPFCFGTTSRGDQAHKTSDCLKALVEIHWQPFIWSCLFHCVYYFLSASASHYVILLILIALILFSFAFYQIDIWCLCLFLSLLISLGFLSIWLVYCLFCYHCLAEFPAFCFILSKHFVSSFF